MMPTDCESGGLAIEKPWRILTSDGSLAISYLPTMSVPVTVDMSQFSGPVRARWFDPSNGSFRSIKGSPFASSGEREFLPPGLNRDKDPDWVLILQVEEE